MVTLASPSGTSEAEILQRISHRRNQRWSNWGKTAHCQPDYTFYPQSVEDLVQIVHFARNQGKRIRAVGTGHSWSALVPTPEVLISVQRLNRVAMDLTDEANPCVIVESGATVLEVNTLLESQGFALPFNVCLLYTSPSPRDGLLSRMPSSA